jgi:hypothetical protein
MVWLLALLLILPGVFAAGVPVYAWIAGPGMDVLDPFSATLYPVEARGKRDQTPLTA